MQVWLKASRTHSLTLTLALTGARFGLKTNTNCFTTSTNAQILTLNYLLY